MLNVGAETLNWWVDQGWQLDLNGDGVPDIAGGVRGITSTAVTAGRLIVTYSDGTSQDAGPVAGGTIAIDLDGVPYVNSGA